MKKDLNIDMQKVHFKLFKKLSIEEKYKKMILGEDFTYTYIYKFLLSIANKKTDLFSIFLEFVYDSIMFMYNSYKIYGGIICLQIFKQYKSAEKLNTYILKIFELIITDEFSSIKDTFTKEELSDINSLLQQLKKEINKEEVEKKYNMYKENIYEYLNILLNTDSLFDYLINITNNIKLCIDFNIKDETERKKNASSKFIELLKNSFHLSSKSMQIFDNDIKKYSSQMYNYKLNQLKLMTFDKQYEEFMNVISFIYLEKFLQQISNIESNEYIYFEKLLKNNIYFIYLNNKADIYFNPSSFSSPDIIVKLNTYIKKYYESCHNQIITLENVFTQEELNNIKKILIQIKNMMINTKNNTFVNILNNINNIFKDYINIMMENDISIIYNHLSKTSGIFVLLEDDSIKDENERQKHNIEAWKKAMLQSLDF